MTDQEIIEAAIDAGLKAVDLYEVAAEDIITRDTLRDFMASAFAICAPAVRERCAEDLRELVERFPEINPSNYDHDDACALNTWGCEVCALVKEPVPLAGLPAAPAESDDSLSECSEKYLRRTAPPAKGESQ